MGEWLICDLESDNLLDKLTKIWCIQVGTVDGTDVTIYADQPGFAPLSEALERIERAEKTIWHNGLGFDIPAILKVYGEGTGPFLTNVLDTLVMARLAFPEERDHSLKAHGRRMDLLKGDYSGDFQSFSKELVTYAIQDIHVGRALFRAVRHVLDWGNACELEHRVAHAIIQQERNGFRFNEAGAVELEATLRTEQADLHRHMQATFAPAWEAIETVTPKVNNKTHGTLKDVPYTKVKLVPFNPSSRHHIAKRLQQMGWKPKDFTPDGHPQVNEKTLAGLRHPAAATLRRHFRLSKMLGMLSDGKAGWLKLVRDGRLHGRVNPNGALTGRMTHSGPNVAQCDKEPRMRALFIPRDGWVLVGCDAEGLEARMLAHYLFRWDRGAFAEKVLAGDIHTDNLNAVVKAGFKITRGAAKVMLYALMYGAGDPKLGNTVIDSLRDQSLPRPALPAREIGALSRQAIGTAIKGLLQLTDAVKARVKSKQPIIGLDGRKLLARGQNSALNTLLQSAGAVAMKVALKLFWEQHAATHGETWGLCANVHDEVQLECEPSIAEMMGQSFADCIVAAGVQLGLKCPLAGKAAVGSDWSQTH